MKDNKIVYGFSDRLIYIRNRKKLSQEMLAIRMGVKKSTIGAYERDVAQPTTDNFYKMCLVLETKADYLLGLERKKYLLVDGLDDLQKRIINDLIVSLRNSQKTSEGE